MCGRGKSKCVAPTWWLVVVVCWMVWLAIVASPKLQGSFRRASDDVRACVEYVCVCVLCCVLCCVLLPVPQLASYGHSMGHMLLLTNFGSPPPQRPAVQHQWSHELLAEWDMRESGHRAGFLFFPPSLSVDCGGGFCVVGAAGVPLAVSLDPQMKATVIMH
jgi:hypothetical protein